MGIDADQLRVHVIQPALHEIGLWSKGAEELVLGTACQESGCGKYLRQIIKGGGYGPARGPFQMEPATHDDMWKNFIPGKPFAATLVDLSIVAYDTPDADEMVWNLRYAAAMCRVHYYRVREVLPQAGDIEAQARYWKQYYNTPMGKGTVAEYVANWKRYAGG